MKRRSFFSFLIVSVAVLLVTGISGCSWLGQPLLSTRQTTPVAAMFVPKQAPVMVSMLVNPGGGKVRAELNQLKTSLLANTGLDYRQDIQPWIGDEITLAVTTADIDRDAANGRQTGYLMAIATKNADKSREFLNLLFSKRAIAGTDLMFEQYKGIKLISDNQQATATQSKNGQPEEAPKSAALSKLKAQNLVGALVGEDFVLFANHPKVLRDAINNVQAPDLNLTTSSQYQQALTSLPPQRIGLTFLNLPSIIAWQGLEPVAQTYQSQVIALELNPKGLLAEVALLAAPNQDSPPASALSQLGGALQYIPATTGFSISGSDLSRLENTNLSQLWQQSKELSGSSDGAISRLVNQPLTDIQARWGIDLPKDIFSWVQGEYALGLLPHEAQTAPDLVFVAEKSSGAEQGISRLDALAQQQGLSITPLSLENQKISAWTQLTTAPKNAGNPERPLIALDAKIQGVHTTVGNYEIFTTSVEAMDQALKAPKNGALVDSPKFQASIDAIPKPNAGYVYLDWIASKTIIERQLPILKLLEFAVKPFFNNLRSLTVSSYGSETGLLKGGIFFRLKN